MAKKTIAKIILEGTIQKQNNTYDQKWVLETIKALGKDKKNAAIVVYLDSPGGSVFESDEVYEALKKYTKETERPVYAYMASLAASGAYYIACATKKIFANKNTLTGSIGVIAGQFIDLSQLMEKHGVKAKIIHSGRNKAMGHISQPATEEQINIMQSVSDECYEQFTALVAENRKLPLEKVKELADGRIYTASQAKELGLVDEILSFDNAIDSIKEELFGDKEFKADVRELRPKKKGLVKYFKEGKFSADPISQAFDAVKLKVDFPAYYWSGFNSL